MEKKNAFVPKTLILCIAALVLLLASGICEYAWMYYRSSVVVVLNIFIPVCIVAFFVFLKEKFAVAFPIAAAVFTVVVGISLRQPFLPLLLCLIPVVLMIVFVFLRRSSLALPFAVAAAALGLIGLIFGYGYLADETIIVGFLMVGVFEIAPGAFLPSGAASKDKKPKKNLMLALETLEKFADLKERGILTEEEFEAKKRELTSQM